MSNSKLSGGFFFAGLISVLLLPLLAQGADVKVDCNKKNQSIGPVLAKLSTQGPNTIHISGNCKESVQITGFENLTLVAASAGASISDPTPSIPDDNDVVDILDSHNVTLQGLAINGGFSGVTMQFSTGYLRELTIQGAAYAGLQVNRASVFVDNSTIQNNAAVGIQTGPEGDVVFASGLFTPGTATIQKNGSAEQGGGGVVVTNGGSFALSSATIQDHPYGDGVNVAYGSQLRVLGSTITGSGNNGVTVQSSVVRLQNGTTISGNGLNGVYLSNTSTLDVTGGNQITGNGGDGVRVGRLSFVRLAGTGTISSNSQTDLHCLFTTSDALIGGTFVVGTTNCTPTPPAP